MANKAQGVGEAQGVMDVGAQVVAMSAYLFISTADSSTISGFFVNGDGKQSSPSFTAAVTGTTPVNWATIAGFAVESKHKGFIGRVATASLAYSTGGGDTDYTADLQSNKGRYPVIDVDSNVKLGRVA